MDSCEMKADDAARAEERRDRRSRCRIYMMPDDRLLLAVQGLYVIEGLPADAEFVGCYYDWNYRAFGIHVVSREFDHVPEGAPLPRYPTVGDLETRFVEMKDARPSVVALTSNQTAERTPDGKVRFREFL